MTTKPKRKYVKNKLTREEEIWIRAWMAVASASDCKESSVPGIWADNCLRKFKETFPCPG